MPAPRRLRPLAAHPGPARCTGPGGRPEYLISQIFSFVSGWAVDQGPNVLADQSPIMLWVTDDQGVPRTGNRRCTEFVGSSDPDDLSGMLHEIVHPDDLDRVREPDPRRGRAPASRSTSPAARAATTASGAGC